MATWYSLTLSADADIEKRHTDITTLAAAGDWRTKHVIAKRELGRRLRMDLLRFADPDYIRIGTDASYSASGADLTLSDSIADEPVIQVGHTIDILSEVADAGSYIITAIAVPLFTVGSSDGTAAKFTETRSGVTYQIRPDILDLIVNPLGLLKDAAVKYALFLVYDDLSLMHDGHKKRAKACLKDFEVAYEGAKSSAQVLIDGEIFRLAKRQKNVPLVRV